jgi:RNA polymerase sigma-70 factor, ECF subfamily
MDAECFKRQYLPYRQKLYRIACILLVNREDAEDIVQEAYYKLWCKRDELAEIREPEAFCVVMVRNLCLDFLKSARNVVKKEDVSVLANASDVSALEEMEVMDTTRQLELLMAQLPEKQRDVLKLRHLCDCSMEEMEQITGLSNVHIRVLLSRARKTLREQYIRMK